MLLTEQGLEEPQSEDEGSSVLDRTAGASGSSCFALACGCIAAGLR
jgi:hypothetical protein